MTDTKICIGGFREYKHPKLSIIILFCDKDYQYIPSLLESISRKVICDYELLLVDNRDSHKGESIPEIELFFKKHKGEYLTKGENLCQLAAKKWALSKAKNDYVWFIDGDDDICDIISDSMLNSCKGDIVAFNYVYNNELEKRIIYQESFYSHRFIRNKRSFRTDTYLEVSCVTCWNKWFKRSLLDKIFKNVPDHFRVSCNEDVYICCAALNNAKVIEERNNFIYVNNPHRGVSNNLISDMSRFNMIAQGWQDSMRLFKLEFPFNTKLFNYEQKRSNDVKYFLNRMYNSKKDIWGQELEVLCKLFTKEELLSTAKEFEYEGYLITLKRDETLQNELRSFIKNSLS